MLVNGLPRYWIGWYDRWHLPLLAGFLGLGVWLALQPRPVLRLSPASRVVAPPSPVLHPTQLDSPQAGGSWKPSQAVEVAGRAHPGVRVVLFHSGSGRPETALAQSLADAQGRFRFALSGLSPGEHVVRAVAYSADGRFAPSVPVPFTVAGEAGRPVRPNRRR